MNKPNLFLIGAMKSGTTTLHDLLAMHPRISMCYPKEPSYFVDPAVLQRHWPEMWRLGIWKDEVTYLNLFAPKAGARYYGESSTDYSKQPVIDGVIERIAAFSPDARFVYIMRDPVERTISHYWHMVEHRGETRAPLDAIRQERHYMDVSNYAYQLEPYVRRFGRDRIYALTFESLIRDPGASMRALYAWLGVEASGIIDAAADARNVTPAEVTGRRRGASWLDQVRRSQWWHHMGPAVPKSLRQVGVRMVERKILRRDVDMGDVIAHLRPIQREETAKLSKLLDHTFDEWKTLYGP